MENKDLNNNSVGYAAGSLEDSSAGVHEAPPEVDSLSLEPEAQVLLSSQEQPHRGSLASDFLHFARRLDVILVFLLLVGGAIAFLTLSHAQRNQNNNTGTSADDVYGQQTIPLGDLVSGKDLSLNGASNVTINGPLQLNNNLLVTPSLQPTGAKAGQIYYDKDSNQLAYYNGSNFVFLTSAPDLTGLQALGSSTQLVTSVGTGLSIANGQIANEGVLSVQGAKGDVTFTAGPGMVINGTNFSNSGILSVAAGSPNVIVSNDGNGNVTIDIAAVPGSGTVTSSGSATSGTIPLFTSSQNIESSIITQSGLTVTISGDLSVVTGGLTLSSALTVSNGGTGATSLAANGVLVGNGTAAINSVAAGSPGLCLLSTSGTPVWGACPSGNGVNSLNGLTGALNIANASAVGTTITIDDASTVNKGIASFNGTNFNVTGGAVNTVQDINSGATPTFAGVNTNIITPNAALTVGVSAQTALLQGSTTTITSNGAGNNIVLNSAGTIELQDSTNVTGNISTSGDLAVNGGDITSTGALNITPSGALTIGSTSQTLTLQGGAATSFKATSGANNTVVAFTSPTANTTLNFPALAAGTYTICTTSGNCAGAGTTLQSAYNNSTSPEITLDATRGALTLRDNATPLGANLLEVQNNTGSATYLAVNASGIAVAGTATVSSNINSSTGALQTNGTNRIDNSGNMVNIGNVTLSGAISGGTTITGSGNINSTGGAIQTNGTSRIDNTGNLINIAGVTASGSATFQGGSLTLGTNSQAGSVVLNDGSNNTGTFQVAALGQNTIYTLPDPGAGTATICLSTGNCAGSGGGVTTSGGTTNRIPKFTGSNSLGDSNISDNGTNVAVSVDVIIQGGDLTVGSASQAASIILHDGNGQTTTLQAGDTAGNLTFILPTSAGAANQCLKQSGTGNQLVWQDCDGGSGGSSATLQTAYNNSTSPEIVLNSSNGGLTLRDNGTPIGGNLFEIQNNLGSTTYLGVTVSGLSVTGTSTSTGNINSTGGALQTNGTTRIDNSGNAVNIGNITGTGAMTIASVGAGNDITIDGADQFIVQDQAVFNALATFNANIDLGANSIIGTTGDINLSNFDVVGATGNVTAGTYNGQTISNASNFTGTVAISGNTTLAADLAVNGGDITSTGALNITPGGALTVGVSAQTALLQGSTTTIRSNGAGNNIVLDSAGTIELQDDTNITGAVTGGTYNGQTISTAANFTGTLSVAGNTTVNGTLAVNGGAITTTGALTIGSSTQALTLQGGATSTFKATSGANTTTVGFVTPIANTTLNFPALAAGTYTICTTSGNCSGASATLQSTYDNSNNPEIVLDATRGALTIRDNASAIGANLLEVQSNNGGTTYLGVTASGIAVTGTATVSGDISTTGGVIKTNGITRIDNSGNLVNIAGLTASGSGSFQGGNLTLGTNSQAGAIVLNDGSSNTGTLQVAALGQNTVYTLPDPGAGTATICLTTGNCSGSGGGVTTSGGTTNKLAKFTGSQNIADSSISDDGTNVTVGVDVIIQGGDLTVGSTSQQASIVLHDGNGQTTTLQAGDSAGNMTFILPTNAGSANQCLKQSGTGNQLVWQDCDGGAGGSSSTLQTAYNNSTNPEIVLNSSNGGLTLRDNGTPIGGNLFEIQNNLGSTTYLAVTVSGLSVTGATSSTGNINTSGGALQTNGTSRIDNSGNLVNIGNITGTGAVTITSVGAGNDITIDGADQFIVQDQAVFNAGATFNGTVTVGANNIVGTTGNIDLTNFDVVGSTGNVTAGTYNGQTISSSANFTGTVAVTGNTTLTADLAVNGGDITSTGALNITPGGTLTAGVTGQQLILQGNANTKLTATSGGFTTTIGFSGVPTANVTYNFDRAAANGIYTICTSIGNCAGSGGGVTTTGGTTGALAKFTGAQTLGDSLLSESGSTVTVNGNLNLVSGNQFQVNGTQISSANLSNDANLAKLGSSQTFTGNTVSFKNGTNSANAFNIQNVGGNRILTVDSSAGQVIVGTSTSLDGKIVFANVSNSNTVTINPGTPTANRTITLPDVSGIICTDSGNCAGAGATLQTGYNFSVGGTTPKIKINSSLLGVDIQDADTPIATNLLNIRASNAAGLGSVMFGVGNTGQALFQNSANSATAFRLLTSGGTSVLTGDTNAGKIILGQSSTLNGTLVFNNATNGNTVTLNATTAGANRTVTLPDADGIVCLSTGNCSGSGSSNTLQAAYDAGNTLTTTSARDITFTLADTATDANFNIATATGSTGFVNVTRANGAGTADPAQMLLLDNLDVDRVQPVGLKIQAAAGGMTTAIDLSDAEIVTAISFGANDLQGTTGNIDLTNFDVAGATGNIITAGDAAINGGDVTSTAALNITASAASTWSTTTGNLSIQAQGNLNLGNGGGQSINIGTDNKAHTITLGNQSTTGAQSIIIGSNGNTGNSVSLESGATGTINIGSAASAHTVNIATGAAAQTVTIGSTNGASATAINGGTGNITLNTNAAAASVIIKSGTNGSNAFQVQNASSSAILNVNTSTNTVTISGDLVQAGIQPGSSAGNGTNGSTSSIASAAGGATSGTTGQTAGNGGNFFIDGGAGGNAPAGSSNGWGGNVFISGGAPGAGAGAGGFRGNVILQGNAGVVGIGTFSPNIAYKLDAAGDINISTGSAYRINGVAICTTTICKTNLQTAYDGSTSTEIVLDTTRGPLTIRRDAAAAVTTLFEVQNNAGTNTYFNVTTGGAFMNGGTFNATDAGTILAGTFRTGDATAASTGSSLVNVNSGQVSGTNSTSGAVFVRSGHSTTSGNTGAVTIISGNATSGTSGGIVIDSGSGSVASGPIIIGGTYAPTITLGRAASNVATTINGTTVFKTAATNSTSAVDFQDTSSVSMLKVDTTNKFIVVGLDTTAGGANASLLIGDTCGSSKQCISLFEGLDINAVTGGDTDVLQMQGGGGIRFSTGYSITSRMVINGSGNVGIGTEDPTEKLTVAGNLNVTSADGSKGYRMRTSGGSLDFEATGVGVPGELWMSGWTGAGYTGTQVNWFRMNAGNRTVTLGTGIASTTPTLLILDRKSTSGDPGGLEGGMYYNDVTDRFRCYQASQWDDCIGTPTIGWTNVSIQSPASDGGAGNSVHRVRRLSTGQVEFQIDVTIAGSTSGVQIATLPTWARPTGDSLRYNPATTASGSLTFNAHIDLRTDGAVYLYSGNMSSLPWVGLTAVYTP